MEDEKKKGEDEENVRRATEMFDVHDNKKQSLHQGIYSNKSIFVDYKIPSKLFIVCDGMYVGL